MVDVLAWDEVMERLDNDRGLFAELVDMFFASYPENLAEIEQAVAETDGERLQTAAHSIKSAVGNLGGMQCHALAYELENLGKSGNFSSAAGVVNAFKAAVAAFKLACEEKR